MFNMAYIRKRYGVPAKRGMRVRYKGNLFGTIKSAKDGYLMILIDGRLFAEPFHPTYCLEYWIVSRGYFSVT